MGKARKPNTDLVELPPRRPRRKRTTADERSEPEMVADTWHLLSLAQALDSGTELAVEDRRWLASRLRRLVAGHEPRDLFLPGHYGGQGRTKLRDLAMALSYLELRLRGQPEKEAVALTLVAEKYDETTEVVRAARRRWNKRRLNAAVSRLDPDARAALVSVLDAAFLPNLF